MILPAKAVCFRWTQSKVLSIGSLLNMSLSRLDYMINFTVPEPDNAEEGKTFLDYLNPKVSSLLLLMENHRLLNLSSCSLSIERLGYFVTDPDSTSDHLVYNLITKLKDSFAKKSQ